MTLSQSSALLPGGYSALLLLCIVRLGCVHVERIRSALPSRRHACLPARNGLAQQTLFLRATSWHLSAMSTVDPQKLARRLSSVKNILLVLSGKGGVGKSSMSVQLALSLLAGAGMTPDDDDDGGGKPLRIGLLDIDLTGPSIPRMLGLDGQSVHQSNDGWVPVYLPIQHLKASVPPQSDATFATKGGPEQQQQQDGQGAGAVEGANGHSASSEVENGARSSTNRQRRRRNNTKDEFKVMSIGFLLKDSRQAVVWRGPKKSAMIRQFLADVRWGELDWLVIDTPPGACGDRSSMPAERPALMLFCFAPPTTGTSDEHISLLENLLPALQATSSTTTLNSVLVTTPQAVSLSDVSKELSFTRRVGLPVLGLIENMSGYVCPHCGDITNIFGKGGGEEFCRLESEKVDRAEQAAASAAVVPAASGTEAPAKRLRFLGRVPVDPDFVKVVDGPGEQGLGLLERYLQTQSSKILADIAEGIHVAVDAERKQLAAAAELTEKDVSGLSVSA